MDTQALISANFVFMRSHKCLFFELISFEIRTLKINYIHWFWSVINQQFLSCAYIHVSPSKRDVGSDNLCLDNETHGSFLHKVNTIIPQYHITSL